MVNKWYITAYEPVYDEEKQIIGVLYVGVPQESVQSLRHAIMDIIIGKSGYVFVLNSDGDYIVSRKGKLDGKNILHEKDMHGNQIIQEICRKSVNMSYNFV